MVLKQEDLLFPCVVVTLPLSQDKGKELREVHINYSFGLVFIAEHFHAGDGRGLARS